MRQPSGFQVPGKEAYVYLIKKSLYGLKNAPKIWHDLISKHLREFGLQASLTDPGLWIGKGIILWLYVDDIVVSGNSKELIAFLE
jgi:hypothetical protein